MSDKYPWNVSVRPKDWKRDLIKGIETGIGDQLCNRHRDHFIVSIGTILIKETQTEFVWALRLILGRRHKLLLKIIDIDLVNH